MRFLWRLAGLSFRGTVRSSDIQREPGVEPLLLDVERSRLKWFGHLITLPLGCVPLDVFWACLFGQKALR